MHIIVLLVINLNHRNIWFLVQIENIVCIPTQHIVGK